MFIPAYSQVGFEGVDGGSAMLVFGLSRWFKKGSFISGRVSGQKKKRPLTPALSAVAHAIQPPQTTPLLHTFLLFSARHYGASEL